MALCIVLEIMQSVVNKHNNYNYEDHKNDRAHLMKKISTQNLIDKIRLRTFCG